MSRNILLTKIDTEVEKINNLIEGGHLEEVRRTRLATHNEQLQNLKKQVQSETVDVTEAEDEFAKLKRSLESI